MIRKKKKAFTLVELLTVISVITLIIGLLVPALNQVNKIAKDMKQKAQFHSIEVAMEMFKAANEAYPESFKQNGSDIACGAQILAESLLGRDMRGFDPKSSFIPRPDYLRTGDDMDKPYYGIWIDNIDEDDPAYKASLERREGPYLSLENADAYNPEAIYSDSSFLSETNAYMGTDARPAPVISDIFYAKSIDIGPPGSMVTVKTGTPLLYFKANEAKNNIDYANHKTDPENMIYNHEDNEDIVTLGLVKDGTKRHTVMDTNQDGTKDDGWQEYFYDKIRNKNIVNQKVPYNKDKYILWSAGYDGDFGTNDDIFNFED